MNGRWTFEYYETLTHTGFPFPQANDKYTDLNLALSEVTVETMKATSMQIQKYQIKYQTANQSASAGSEGEMKVYSQSLSVLEKILQN